MVPSIDTYIYKEISSRLSVILKNCYIIDTVLKDMDFTAKDNFKKAFCGESPKHAVDLSYEYPATKEQVVARIVVQLGDGSEELKSLGGIEGDYGNREGEYKAVKTVATKEGDRLYFQVPDTIGVFQSLSSIEFAEDDDVKIEGNRLSFNYDPAIEGLVSTMYYTSTPDTTVENFGTVKGFTARENVSIVGVSTNIDTARCLDLIVKVILITMRDNLQEQSYYGLQTLTFGALTALDTGLDLNLYGRPVNISFLVSYGVDLDFNVKLNNLILKERGK